MECINHAYAIVDDILIAGRDIAYHDSFLETVLHRAKSYNLRLHFEKVTVRKQHVQYVGHIISAEGLRPRKSESYEAHATSKGGCASVSWIYSVSV